MNMVVGATKSSQGSARLSLANERKQDSRGPREVVEQPDSYGWKTTPLAVPDEQYQARG